MEKQISGLLSALILQELGFQDAEDTNIPAILKKIYPKGGTAFRDSLIQGCQLMIKLYEMLQKTGVASNWNFAHVILTDGEDQHSNTSLQNTLQVMSIIGQKLNVKILKIILIGVGVSGKAENELRLIAKAGGENAQYHSVRDADIEKIFQRITVNLGLQRRQQIIGLANQTGTAFLMQQQVNPVLSLQRQKFGILLNLDVSSSMYGQKWRRVCQSVDQFADFLGSGDLLAAMVFNHETKMLSKMDSDDNLFDVPEEERQKQQPKIVIQTQHGNVQMNPQECAIM